jgi:hypothetical protein
LADQQLSSADIAEALRLSARTVRRLLRLEPADLRPKYHHCGRKPRACPEALDLRQEHRFWGAPYIRVVLQEQVDGPWPSTRSLQRLFARAGLAPARPGRRPRAEGRRAREPHHTWQMDACERIRLRSEQEVSWLRLVDEYTGAFLATRVFPPRLLAAGAPAANPGAVA